MQLGFRSPLLLTIIAMLFAQSAQAAVVLGGAPPNNNNLSTILFDQIGLVNPQVTVTNVPNVGDLTVSFRTHFVGQTLGMMHNSLDNTVPLPPLRLDPSGTVATLFDLGSPTGIMLGGREGQTMFTTPLAMLFSSDVNFVSFDLGDLDAHQSASISTFIEAFDRSGNSLGIFGNLSQGFNTYSLTETTGNDVIAGVSIYVPSEGMDWEGFGINSIKFSDGGGMIPEPGSLMVWSLLGSCAIAGVWLKRRRVA